MILVLPALAFAVLLAMAARFALSDQPDGRDGAVLLAVFGVAVPISRLYEIDTRIGVSLAVLVGPLGLIVLVYVLGGAKLARDGQLPPIDF